MSKTRKESLSVYVENVMKEKRLSRRDVKLRSGGEITDSYVSGIISGTATNLSVSKLKALARGLRVSEIELIRAAFGWAKGEEVERTTDQSHNLILLDVAKKSVLSTDIAEIASETLKLSPADRNVVLRYVRRLIRTERRLKRKGSI